LLPNEKHSMLAAMATHANGMQR